MAPTARAFLSAALAVVLVGCAMPDRGDAPRDRNRPPVYSPSGGATDSAPAETSRVGLPRPPVSTESDAGAGFRQLAGLAAVVGGFALASGRGGGCPYSGIRWVGTRSTSYFTPLTPASARIRIPLTGYSTFSLPLPYLEKDCEPFSDGKYDLVKSGGSGGSCMLESEFQLTFAAIRNLSFLRYQLSSENVKRDPRHPAVSCQLRFEPSPPGVPHYLLTVPAPTAQAPPTKRPFALSSRRLNSGLVSTHTRPVLDGVHSVVDTQARVASKVDPGWSVLPHASYRSLGGEVDGTSYRGSSTQAAVSADWAIPGTRLGTGLVAAHTSGELDYWDSSKPRVSGPYHHLDTVSLTPYVRGAGDFLGRETVGWAAFTAGRGNLELESSDPSCPRFTADTRLRAAAAGLDHQLPVQGLSLAGRLEASSTRVMDASTASCAPTGSVVTRDGRAELRYAPGVFGDGGRLEPELAVGMRHRGGDGDTGRSLTSRLATRFGLGVPGGRLTGRLGVGHERGVGSDSERRETEWSFGLQYRQRYQRGLEVDLGTDGFASARAGYAVGAADGGRVVPYVEVVEDAAPVLGIERRFGQTGLSGRVEYTRDDGEGKAVHGRLNVPLSW